MAKLPHWMWTELRREDNLIIVYIRWWHPYVWYLYIKGRIKRLLSNKSYSQPK